MANVFQTSTQGATLIDDIYHASVVDAVYFNNFMGLTVGSGENAPQLFPKINQMGDTAARWVVRREANDSIELFTEGQAQSAPSASLYSAAAISWSYARVMIQITGHALDAMRSGRASTSSIVDVEVATGAKSVGDLLTTTFLGSSAGLTNAIAATGTYAGIARGSATYWESKVTTVSRALEYGDLADLLEACLDNDRGGRSFAWLMGWNQCTNLYNLGGASSVKQIGPTDIMQGYLGQTVSNFPVFGVPDLDDNTILLLNTDEGQNAIVVEREMQVKQMAPSGDSDIYQISMGAAIVHRNPLLSGKLASVDA